MIPRRLALLVALAAAATIATACAPEPEPAPAAPAFATEADAFAAAEETYRAYVDALNQVDLSDPQTFEPVFAWTTGDANKTDRKTFSQMHGSHWTVAGVSEATTVEPSLVNTKRPDQWNLAVCLDVSRVSVVDLDGLSVVSADRGDFQSLLVTLVPSGETPTGLSISRFEGRSGVPTCR